MHAGGPWEQGLCEAPGRRPLQIFGGLFDKGPRNLKEALGEKHDQQIYCTEFDTWK